MILQIKWGKTIGEAMLLLISALCTSLSQPPIDQPPTHEFEKLQYQNVQFALPDGSPDRTKPVNSWEEVRLSRHAVLTSSNATDAPHKTSFRIGQIGSVNTSQSSPLPADAPAFTLPEPGENVLHIHRPRNSFVMRDVEVAPGQKKIVYSVLESRTKAESRFFKGKEYVRWRTSESIIRYEEVNLPINRP